MKRILCTLVVLGLVCGAPHAWASCRPFGTQLRCTLGSGLLLIGTQTAPETRRSRMLPVLSLQAADGLFDDRPVGSWPLRLELQNVGTDPGLCWRFGEETYCH